MQPWFRRHLTAFRHVNGRGLASIAHLPDPHLTRSSRAFPPRRSAQRSSANAPVGGLKPPPAGRLQRAKTTSIASTAPHSAGPPSTNPSYLLRSRSQHLSHSTTYKKTYLHRPPSVFGTHGCCANHSNTHCSSDGGRTASVIPDIGAVLPTTGRDVCHERVLSRQPIDAPGF
jgi:hypothetical protein